MKRRIHILLLVVSVISSLTFGSAGSWLQPTDEQISRAIDSGFQASNAASYHGQSFNPQKSKIGDDYVQQPSITIIPPLLCSYGAGLNAHNKLQDKPLADTTKRVCSGKILVLATHISSSLNTNWPVVLERNEDRLQPTRANPDAAPTVTRYTTPFGERVGYQYTDKYMFTIPDDWTSGFNLTYADDSGKHHTVAVDTKKFEADVR